MHNRVALARDSMGRGMRTFFQAGLLIGLWWVCEAASRTCHLGVPGGVLGLFVLAALLLSGRFPVRWVSGGAGLLLDNFLLFFVPAAMTLLNHPEFLGWTGLKVVAVVVVGIFLVMVGTAMAVEWHLVLRSRHVR
ncbi:CidA/LrgA family protein [Pseudodesulfovibrio sp.]|uniref:CidA/LrgA family protein n=1 Tax=Pseudodesulfovibrio sp. TaxID=2035812 RepID=UPI00262EC640|nr:CidA/LrgA family protein [Pseudodesulfovibrio sp.]MDD3311234.1 CidA/LrgA family protein [Pseudodesulfovibrio sp.]